jgi:hypothetical protein
MSVQPSQPAQGAFTVASSDRPAPKISVPSDSVPSDEVFQVTSLKLRFESGLSVEPHQPDSTNPGKLGVLPTHMISSEAKFAATVRFTGQLEWKLGWVQTVEPHSRWVRYRGGGRTGLHRTTIKARMRDGDDDEGYWYEGGRDADTDDNVSAPFYDAPNIAFYYPTYPSEASLPDLAGLAPTDCGGQMEFWAWLLAVRENDQGQPVEQVYLHHVHWKVVFDGQISGDGDEAPTVIPGSMSGVQLICQGVGQGGATPILGGPAIGPEHEDHRAEMDSP